MLEDKQCSVRTKVLWPTIPSSPPLSRFLLEHVLSTSCMPGPALGVTVINMDQMPSLSFRTLRLTLLRSKLSWKPPNQRNCSDSQAWSCNGGMAGGILPPAPACWGPKVNPRVCPCCWHFWAGSPLSCVGGERLHLAPMAVSQPQSDWRQHGCHGNEYASPWGGRVSRGSQKLCVDV